jgi:hypothetical protein
MDRIWTGPFGATALAGAHMMFASRFDAGRLAAAA